MFKWIKKLFEPPVDKSGKLIFYGPLYAYQLYNNNLCINIVNLVQRGDYDIYITEKHSNDQHYIFDGLQLPSYLAYHRQEFANEIKAELLNTRTIFGKSI